MDFWHFSIPTSTAAPLAGVYDPPLVVLSLVIAWFAGLAALSIVDRIIATDDRRSRQYWLVAGATAMGCGIWAMHFTGMLAFSLPITVRYGLDITLLSVAPAILGSGAAIHCMAKPQLGGRRLQLGALLMAAGIGTMHYTGMEAMRMHGVMHYDFTLFCLSLVVAHVLAMAAIYIRFVIKVRLSLPLHWVRLSAAIVMGTAVSGMHYTAMAAASFYPATGMGAISGEYSNLAMGTTIGGFSTLILTLALLATLVDRRIAASEQLHRAEKLRADTILNTTADGILALDRHGTIISANPAVEKLFGCSSTDLHGRPISWLISDYRPAANGDRTRPSAGADDGLGMAPGIPFTEFTGIRGDGGTFPLEVTTNTMHSGHETITVLSLRDITERKRAQETIRRIEERFSFVARATADAIWDWDLATDVIWWSEGMQTLFGYDPAELEPDSQSWTRRIHPDDKDHVLQDIHHAIEGNAKEWSAEYRFMRRDGSVAHVIDRGFVIRDQSGKAMRMVGGMTDITERKNAEAEIEKLAFYDSLTQLPNRALLMDRLEHAIANSDRNKRHGALLFIDLDDFKTLNDTMGHDAGDQLLQHVARRLGACIRESDTVARLGGDEFVVILENLNADANTAAAETEVVSEKILAIFHRSFCINDHECHTTPSIGATLFFGHDTELDELLKQADIAMYQAKIGGGNAMRFFDPEMQSRISARVEMEKNLRQAINSELFVLHYQPVVSSKGELISAEALVRCRHPQRGLISPAEFIPLAEETGLILPLGKWIMETACRQLANWAEDAATARINLSINVSANQFRHPGFADQLFSILDHTGAAPSRLNLEITEHVLVENMEDTTEKMAALKARGTGFMLDDFGTGYSSLYYLKHLPLDQIKIDQSFIRDVLTDASDAVIVQAIIAMAQNLGLTVVAEGVETEAQRDFLYQQGCHHYQGFLFSKPLPVEAFEALIREPPSWRYYN